MNQLCDRRVICECAEDSPFSNLSAEAPDIERFFSIVNFFGDVPLGDSFEQTACRTVCYSTISQADADLCALRQAQQCVWDSPGFGGDFRTPPTIEHPDGTSIAIFSNRTQFCTTTCPDGLPFTVVIAAGVILGLSQEQADFLALSYACQQASMRQICMTLEQPVCCQNQFTETRITATGLSAVNNWALVSGAVPTGMHFFGGSVPGDHVIINGTPTTVGSFVFTVRVITPEGHTQIKTFTMTVAAITNPATLPDAHLTEAYSQTLTATGISGTLVWTIVAGTLPAGLTLDSATGLISGTPTTIESHSLSIQVSNGTDSCTKNFTIAVACLAPLAYWKYDEVGSVIRTDVIVGVTQDPNLVGVGVGSAAGLIGNAAKFSTNVAADVSALLSVGAKKMAPSGPSSSLFFWVQWPAYANLGPNQHFLVDFQQYDPVTSALLFEMTFAFDDILGANRVFLTATGTGGSNFPFTPTAGQWYSVYMFHDAAAGNAGFEVYQNDVLIVTLIAAGASAVPAANDPLLDITMTHDPSVGVLNVLLDETAVFGQTLTASQRQFLRNAGAGRQWPYCLPP